MNTPTPLHRSRRLARPGCALLWIALLLSAPAHAVQHCRIDGRLVIQATPCPQPAAVAATGAVVAVAAVVDTSAAPKQRSMADVMREREAAQRTRPPVQESQPDGARILRDRMGAL